MRINIKCIVFFNFIPYVFYFNESRAGQFKVRWGLYSVVSVSKPLNQVGGFDIRFGLFFFTESVIWGVFNRRFSLLGSGLLLEEGRNIVGSSVSGTFSMKLPCLEKSTVCNLGQ